MARTTLAFVVFAAAGLRPDVPTVVFAAAGLRPDVPTGGSPPGKPGFLETGALRREFGPE